jgi:hypothetical protein
MKNSQAGFINLYYYDSGARCMSVYSYSQSNDKELFNVDNIWRGCPIYPSQKLVIHMLHTDAYDLVWWARRTGWSGEKSSKHRRELTLSTCVFMHYSFRFPVVTSGRVSNFLTIQQAHFPADVQTKIESFAFHTELYQFCVRCPLTIRVCTSGGKFSKFDQRAYQGFE